MEKLRPFISVIIPTYDRPTQLFKCLCAFAAQDYPRDRFEVVVVDDGSVEQVNDPIGSLRHQLDITLLKQPHSGPASARNYGAAHAKGTYLAFTDDDCIPASDWLRRLSTSFPLFPEAVVGGRTINQLVDNPYSTASQLLVDYLYTRWNPASMHATFFASNNLALPATCFHAVGGFDRGWNRAAGEDRDFCDRLIGHGYRLVYVPEALVHHAHFLTFRSFFRQHFTYGWGAYRLHQLRAERAGEHTRFGSLAFYLKTIAYPFTQTRVCKAAVLAMLLGVAQTANAIGWLAAGLSGLGKRSSQRGEAMERRRVREETEAHIHESYQRRLLSRSRSNGCSDFRENMKDP